VIELQIVSLFLVLAWLWNVEKQWVKTSSFAEARDSNDLHFYFFMFRSALKYLNFKTSAALRGALEEDLIQTRNPRFQLAVLGLSQISFFAPLAFLLLLFQIQPLILFLLFFCFYFITSQSKSLPQLTEGLLFLALILLLMDPLWRLTSLAFAQGDSSFFWYGLTRTDFLPVLCALFFVGGLSFLIRRTLGWSEFFTISASMLFLSYQLSAVLWAAIVLGERLSACFDYDQTMKKLRLPFRKAWSVSQVLSGALVFTLVLVLDPVALPEREGRWVQLVFFFLSVQSVFFVVAMIAGHFLALTYRQKAKD
jgi:hypothetical protein